MKVLAGEPVSKMRKKQNTHQKTGTSHATPRTAAGSTSGCARSGGMQVTSADEEEQQLRLEQQHARLAKEVAQQLGVEVAPEEHEDAEEDGGEGGDQS